MVLPSERKRRALRESQETEGFDLWSEDVPQAARVKIAEYWRFIRDHAAQDHYELDTGVAHIMRVHTGRPVDEIKPETFIRASDSELALDMLGAFFLFIADDQVAQQHIDQFRSYVNNILEDYRVAYRIVDDEVIPIRSDELHSEVVVPALGLLIGDKFKKAGEAYRTAIKEIPKDPANAITDAGTALQETLVALGCKGNSLGSLITSAKKKVLLAAHDAKLAAGLESFLEWASADRSERGDGHHVSDATRADAWLMVHVVGALVVRLVDPLPRGSSSSTPAR